MKECFQKALALLNRKNYSRFKLEAKLKEKGYGPEEREQTFQRLESLSLWDEEVYIRQRFLGLVRKGDGPSLINQKLQAEKIELSKNKMSELLKEEGITHEEFGRHKALKKWQELTRKEQDKNKRKEKFYRYLLGKGWSFQDLERWLQEFKQAESDCL